MDCESCCNSHIFKWIFNDFMLLIISSNTWWRFSATNTKYTQQNPSWVTQMNVSITHLESKRALCQSEKQSRCNLLKYFKLPNCDWKCFIINSLSLLCVGWYLQCWCSFSQWYFVGFDEVIFINEMQYQSTYFQPKL